MPRRTCNILHPPEARLPGIISWLAEFDKMRSSDAAWDGCAIHTVEYDLQAAFDVATRVDSIRRHPGPVVIVQKVQARLRDQFEHILGRSTSIYSIPLTCPEDYGRPVKPPSERMKTVNHVFQFVRRLHS